MKPQKDIGEVEILEEPQPFDFRKLVEEKLNNKKEQMKEDLKKSNIKITFSDGEILELKEANVSQMTNSIIEIAQKTSTGIRFLMFRIVNIEQIENIVED